MLQESDNTVIISQSVPANDRGRHGQIKSP